MVEDTFETALNAFLGTSTWPTQLPLGRLTTEVRQKGDAVNLSADSG